MPTYFTFFPKLKSFVLLFSFVFIYQAANAQGIASDDWSQKIQLYGHGFSVPTDFTDAEYEFIANTYDIFTVEKRHAYNTYGGNPSTERSTIGTAAKLKTINPDIKVLLYWNSVMSYDNLYESNAEFVAHPEWVHSRWATGYDIYDLDNIDCQNWWVNSIVEIITDGNLDGVFLDAGPKVDVSGLTAGYNTAVDRVRDSIGTDKIVIYNGYRVATNMQAGPEMSDHQSGVFIEFFLHTPLDTKEEAALLYDNLIVAYEDGKMIVPCGKPSSYLPGTPAEDRFAFSFASFLLFYGPNSYWIYNDGYDKSEGMLDYYPDYYDRATGQSLGSAKRNGWVYTRDFENVSISVDLENLTHSIVWSDSSIVDPPDPVAVTGVSVSPATAEIQYIGNATKLTSSVAPSNATKKTVSWSSSNEGVATVSSTGLVTAISKGTATITAKTTDGGFTGECVISSKGEIIPPTQITGEYHISRFNSTFCLYGGTDDRVEGGPVMLQTLIQGDASMTWVENLRADGYYYYQLKGTNFCMDAGDGGAKNQPIVISAFDSENKNQQWEKEYISDGVYRLIKRDVAFAIDAGSGASAIDGKPINLWISTVTSANLHWTFTDATGEASGINENAVQNVNIYPNPAYDFLMITTDKEMSKVNVFTIDGQLLQSKNASGTSLSLELPIVKSATLLVHVVLVDGYEITKKVMVKPHDKR